MLDLGVERLPNSMFVNSYRQYLVTSRNWILLITTVSISSLLSECPPGAFTFLAFLSQCGHTD